MEITIFHEKIHYEWLFLITMVDELPGGKREQMQWMHKRTRWFSTLEMEVEAPKERSLCSLFVYAAFFSNHFSVDIGLMPSVSAADQARHRALEGRSLYWTICGDEHPADHGVAIL